ALDAAAKEGFEGTARALPPNSPSVGPRFAGCASRGRFFLGACFFPQGTRLYDVLPTILLPAAVMGQRLSQRVIGSGGDHVRSRTHRQSDIRTGYAQSCRAGL